MTNQSPCTCHPLDRPPVCQHRYAAHECHDAYYVSNFELPHWEHCMRQVKAGRANVLELFIYHEEPAGTECEAMFRQRLRELLLWARAAESESDA